MNQGFLINKWYTFGSKRNSSKRKMAHVFVFHLIYQFKVPHVFCEDKHCVDKLAILIFT